MDWTFFKPPKRKSYALKRELPKGAIEISSPQPHTLKLEITHLSVADTNKLLGCFDHDKQGVDIGIERVGEQIFLVIHMLN